MNKQIKKSWITKFIDLITSSDTPEKIVQNYRIFKKNKKQLDTNCNIIIE
jgi:hypothetical protein